jgi:hypothetical protein
MSFVSMRWVTCFLAVAFLAGCVTTAESVGQVEVSGVPYGVKKKFFTKGDLPRDLRGKKLYIEAVGSPALTAMAIADLRTRGYTVVATANDADEIFYLRGEFKINGQPKGNLHGTVADYVQASAGSPDSGANPGGAAAGVVASKLLLGVVNPVFLAGALLDATGVSSALTTCASDLCRDDYRFVSVGITHNGGRWGEQISARTNDIIIGPMIELAFKDAMEIFKPLVPE